jgi:hypothetical protein
LESNFLFFLFRGWIEDPQDVLRDNPSPLFTLWGQEGGELDLTEGTILRKPNKGCGESELTKNRRNCIEPLVC